MGVPLAGSLDLWELGEEAREKVSTWLPGLLLAQIITSSLVNLQLN